MRKSRLSITLQNRLIEHFIAGTTARCAAELIGVNRNTAIYYYHRLRLLISDKQEQEAGEIFEGEICLLFGVEELMIKTGLFIVWMSILAWLFSAKGVMMIDSFLPN